MQRIPQSLPACELGAHDILSNANQEGKMGRQHSLFLVTHSLIYGRFRDFMCWRNIAIAYYV